MVTTAQIQKRLAEGELGSKGSLAISEAIELAQRQTQETVETDLRRWMVDKFLTKEDGARMEGRLEGKIAQLEVKIAEAKAEIIKWTFFFWVGLIPVLILVVKYVK